ncbi:MAG: HEAT repeat domain-containing protein [Granulosicoccus sp.]
MSSFVRTTLAGFAVLMFVVMAGIFGWRYWYSNARVSLGVDGETAVNSSQYSKESVAALPAAKVSSNTGNTVIVWRNGAGNQYTFDVESTMSMPADSGNLSPVLDIKLSGVLEQLVLDGKGPDARIGSRLSDVVLMVSGQQDSAIADALQVPFRMLYTDGAVPVAGSFEFSETIDSESRTIIENLMLTFQVSMDSTDSANWLANERHASGQYLAYYQRIGATNFTKAKRDFTPQTGSSMIEQAELVSDESITLDPLHNVISAMGLSETLRNAGQSGPVLELSTKATLDRVDGATLSIDRTLFEFESKGLIMPGSATPATAAASMSEAQARNSLLDRLPMLDSAESNRTQHIHALRDLLKAHDSLASTLVAELKADRWTQRTRADVFLAFELAGTSSAQSALGSIIGDATWSGNDTVRAIIALGAVANPTPEAIDTLRDAANTRERQIASTALFALGAAGGALQRANDSGYESLRSELLSGAQGTADPQLRADFASALGNTRDSDLAEPVGALLQDDEPMVRKAAAQSLAPIANVQSVEILTRTLATENDEDVRASIADTLSALSVSDTTAMQQMATLLVTERSEKARYAMAGYLAQHLGKHPELQPQLRKHLRHEPSKRVRERIAEGLAALGK